MRRRLNTVVDNLDAICRVPGVDAVFIGPSDLAAALGGPGQVWRAPLPPGLLAWPGPPIRR